jgi:hypothetical protein
MQSDLDLIATQSFTALSKMLKRSYADLTNTQELSKLPETATVELELSNTLDDLYNNFYHQFMDQVQPKKLIDFLKNFTVTNHPGAMPSASSHQAVPTATELSHISTSYSNSKEKYKRKADDSNKPISKRVEFLSPPMPPMPPQVSDLVDEVDMTDISGVKDNIENKLSKLYTYGNQYRNFALEFLSQYLSLLGEFGMQFKDLGVNVVKSIGNSGSESKQ